MAFEMANLHRWNSEWRDGSKGLQEVAEDIDHRDPDDGPEIRRFSRFI